MKNTNVECCILGAGPAGLGVASELNKHGVTSILIVDRNHRVGGLARTEHYDGARFDIGPHRFFTKNAEVNALWHETLGKDFRPVDRLTRILYNNRYFNYPISAVDALIKLGPIASLSSLLSFLRTRVNTPVDPATFEDWVTAHFGKRLYETFFKTYTEKVWGIPCSRIGKEWAAQRIKGLDLKEVLRSAVLGNGNNVKTLVEQFDYPALGAGQMYEAMAEKVAAQGGEFMLGARVQQFNRQAYQIDSVDIEDGEGEFSRITARHYFNSIPLTHFFSQCSPLPSEDVMAAVNALYYRDHITVNLLVDGTTYFPDQWIYIHAPEVKMARIANYNSFSASMVDDLHTTALSVEYFVFQTDELWQMDDSQLAEFAIAEMEAVKLIRRADVIGRWVIRETESYPTYYLGFQEPYNTLRTELTKYDNLSSIGRGGMYKYNNQDHSVYSGMLAARNYLQCPEGPFELWDINIDAEYHESADRVTKG